jgi:hypothetical protein
MVTASLAYLIPIDIRTTVLLTITMWAGCSTMSTLSSRRWLLSLFQQNRNNNQLSKNRIFDRSATGMSSTASKRRAVSHPSSVVVKKRTQSTISNVALPSRRQLWLVFCHAAVPMVGFGFMGKT